MSDENEEMIQNYIQTYTPIYWLLVCKHFIATIALNRSQKHVQNVKNFTNAAYKWNFTYFWPGKKTDDFLGNFTKSKKGLLVLQSIARWHIEWHPILSLFWPNILV